MSGPLVYIEYISRRPGVSLEAFHALAGHGQTGWAGDNPEEVLLANLGRTWRTGPEPEYLAFWYTPGQGLDRFDDWERIFRSGEADEFEEPFKIAARIDRAGSYDPLIEPRPVATERVYIEFFDIARGVHARRRAGGLRGARRRPPRASSCTSCSTGSAGSARTRAAWRRGGFRRGRTWRRSPATSTASTRRCGW